MGIAINVNGKVAPRSVPPLSERSDTRKAPRPQRSRREQMRYENGLVRHVMLGTGTLVVAGYGLAMAIASF